DADAGRLPDEPGMWYARFEAFRMLGPRRSILAVYNSEREKDGESAALSVPGAWNDAAKTWRWRDRAATWDAEQTRLARVAEADELAERRRAWIKQARSLQDKAVERLETMGADELSFKDVLAALGEGMKLELLARGQATEIGRVEHADADDTSDDAERMA